MIINKSAGEGGAISGKKEIQRHPIGK